MLNLISFVVLAMAQHCGDLVDPPTRAERAMPLFVENLGQWDTPARFVGAFGGGLVRAEPDGLAIQLSGSEAGTGVLVRLAFEGASETPAIVAEALWEATCSYFLG